MGTLYAHCPAGPGEGLKNGIFSNFNDRAINTVNIWPSRTQLAYKGYQPFRRVQFTIKDLDFLSHQFPAIEKISGRIYQSATVSYRQESSVLSVEGVMPDMKDIDLLKITAGHGRFIDRLDMDNTRKVIVLTEKARSLLFKQQKGIGKWVFLNGIPFQVICVDTICAYDENIRCFIPLRTAQQLFQKGIALDAIHFTVNGLTTKQANEQFTDRLRSVLNRRLTIHPDDQAAIHIWNQAANYVETINIFRTINLFLLFIGICTLIAGVVGISNIMVITVKERTKEFGIRKALGATPLTILNSILLESITITVIFGYAGMLLGMGVLEILNQVLGKGNGSAGSQSSIQLFLNPSVDMGTISLATVILIVSGLLSGYFPAKRAVNIKPVEAMRAD